MRTLILLLLAFAVISCQPGVVGNGKVVKRVIPVDDFDQLEVNGAYNIYVRQGDEPNLEIEMDENLFDYLEIDQNEGELEIESERMISKAEARNIYITVRNMRHININGANELETRGGLKGRSLSVEANGATEMRVEFEGSRLSVESNGGSDLRFRGAVGELQFEVNGASEINAVEMKALRADINVSGAADVLVWAEEELSINASGASSVKYKGNPSINKSTSEASSVSRKTE